jgi:hypothetical protein
MDTPRTSGEGWTSTMAGADAISSRVDSKEMHKYLENAIQNG